MNPKRHIPVALTAGGGLFLLFALYLARYAYANRPFTEEGLIYDLIWLDAWALAFAGVLLLAFFARVRPIVRARVIVLACAVWGAVTILLFFHGTPYGMNAYFGDQTFRIAMILKFREFWSWGDYYYKDLPAFYPPVLYWLLGVGARVLSANAFLMIKAGSVLIYLCSPVLLYWLWRRIVTPFQAAMIAVFSILFVSFDKTVPLLAPHAFLANALFIPWWFSYVEQVRQRQVDWRFYAVGGIVGGLLFSTYYFPFFIGALILLVRLFGRLIHRTWAIDPANFRWRRAWLVLGVSAVVAAPFWAPLLWSFMTVGYEAAQQEWHHIGSTGIGFRFLQFSLPGLAYLAALLFAVRRIKQPLYRGMIWLVGAVLLFHLIGSVLGALNRPVNLIKAGEFIALAGGPLLGLAASSWLRTVRHHTRPGAMRGALVLALVLVMLHQVNGTAKHEMVRTARTTAIPTWGLDTEEMTSRRGTVFLSSHEKLSAFYPVYVFYAINQHYSHPAGQLTRRLELLDALQTVHDPYLFNLVLRANRYDPVDYFMPRVVDGRYEFIVALSNYPNKYRHEYYRFDTTVTGDSLLFALRTGDRLYQVMTPSALPPPIEQSARSQEWLTTIGPHLTPDGHAELRRYLGLAE